MMPAIQMPPIKEHFCNHDRHYINPPYLKQNASALPRVDRMPVLEILFRPRCTKKAYIREEKYDMTGIISIPH